MVVTAETVGVAEAQGGPWNMLWRVHALHGVAWPLIGRRWFQERGSWHQDGGDAFDAIVRASGEAGLCMTAGEIAGALRTGINLGLYPGWLWVAEWEDRGGPRECLAYGAGAESAAPDGWVDPYVELEGVLERLLESPYEHINGNGPRWIHGPYLPVDLIGDIQKEPGGGPAGWAWLDAEDVTTALGEIARQGRLKAWRIEPAEGHGIRLRGYHG